MPFNVTKKDIAITPGIDYSLEFEFIDTTFLPKDPAGYTYKFELLDTHNSPGKLMYSSTAGFSGVSGTLYKQINATDLVAIKPSVYSYRLVSVNNSTSKVEVVANGICSVSDLPFDYSSQYGQEIFVLPDGVLYAKSATEVQLGSWYVASRSMILSIEGNATFTMSVRLSAGVEIELYDSRHFPGPGPASWTFVQDGIYAFRLTRTSGSLTSKVMYLPT